MNTTTPGKNTTEFYVTVATNIINAIFMILIAAGVLTQEESGMWEALIASLLLAALPIATMFVNKEYTRGRTAVKLGAMTQENTIHISPSIEITDEYTEEEWVPANNAGRPEATQ